MTDLKIAAESWTGQTEGSLDTMSTTAAQVVSDKDAYPEVIPEAATLTTAASDYHLAYSRYARFGGTDNKDLKNTAKTALYDAHVATAKKLEATANGSKEYLTRPGYRLDGTGGKPSLARVQPPYVKKVESVKVRGRVKFILGTENAAREIKGIVGKSSLDNGASWQNGIFELGLNFTLEGQASGKAVLYQFMFKATNGRDSDWSDIIRVDVF